MTDKTKQSARQVQGGDGPALPLQPARARPARVCVWTSRSDECPVAIRALLRATVGHTQTQRVRQAVSMQQVRACAYATRRRVIAIPARIRHRLHSASMRRSRISTTRKSSGDRHDSHSHCARSSTGRVTATSVRSRIRTMGVSIRLRASTNVSGLRSAVQRRVLPSEGCSRHLRTRRDSPIHR